MKEYMITFGVELSDEQLNVIETRCRIPAKIGTVYINANSPWKAMRIFKKKYNIKKFIFRTTNHLKQVYIVRPTTCDSFVGFRVAGLTWAEDFTTLI